MTDEQSEPFEPTSDQIWAVTSPIETVPESNAPDSPSPRDRRTAVVIGVVSFVLLMVVGLVATLSLDGNDPVSITTDTDAPSTTVAAATTVPAPTTVATTPIPGVGMTTVVETTTTTIASAIPTDRSITVAGAGLYDLTINSSTTVNNEQWAVAFRLPDGSVIAQHVFPGYGEPGDNTVYRIGATTSVVLAPSDPNDEWVRLHDVYREGSTFFALVSVKSGTGFDAAREELFTVNLDTGEKTSYDMIGGWEEGPSRLSYGSGLIVGEYFSSITAGPYFLSLDGATINPNDLGLSDSYDDCAVCPSRFATDPSGTRIVWVEGDLLVVFDRNTGTRIAEARLPAGLGRDVDSIDVLGNTAIVNAYDRTTGILGAAYVVGFDGTSTQLPTPGRATFDL